MSDIKSGDLFYDDDGDFYLGSTKEYLECSDVNDYIKDLEKERDELRAENRRLMTACAHHLYKIHKLEAKK